MVTYDGERTENFACAVGEQIICGTFRGAHRFQNGDQVKFVVSPVENGVLYAHAIQRPADKWLWLPAQVHCGARADFRHDVKLMTYASIISFFVCSTIWTIVFFSGGGPSNYKHWLAVILAFAIFGPALCFAVAFLPGRPAKKFGEIGSKIFTLLQFPSPADLDMLRASLQFQTDWQDVQDIYLYQLAIDTLQSGTKIVTLIDRERATMKEKKRQQTQLKE